MSSENNTSDFSTMDNKEEIIKKDIPKYNPQGNPYYNENKNSENKNVKIKLKDHKYSLLEKMLIPVSLIFSLLLNFWVLDFTKSSAEFTFFLNLFYSVVIIGYILLSFKKIKKNIVVWIVLSLTILLNIWSYIFDYTSDYGSLVSLVIPVVLFTVIEYVKYEIEFKNAIYVVKKWFSDLFVWPFTAIKYFFGSNISVIKSLNSSDSVSKSGSNIKKIGIGALISVPVLFVILPLLFSADIAFANFFENILDVIFYETKIGDVIFHIVKILFYIIFIYSFLWNMLILKVKTNGYIKKNEKKYWDSTIVSSFLIILLIFYFVFCAMQFTYLFPGQGLPNGITYSAYAREGFSQIILVAIINLSIFSLLNYFTKNNKIILVLKGLLLITTAIMLVSSFLRLLLYIEEYHMTWLRLLSMWFIFFLGALLILCIVKMIKKDFMIVGVASIMLLVWFVVLGYANPERIIAQYNISNSENVTEFLMNNENMMRYHLTSDEILCYYDNEIDIFDVYKKSDIVRNRTNSSRDDYSIAVSKWNLTSYNLRSKYIKMTE